MKIVVIGAGAIGAIVAARLGEAAEHEILVVDGWDEHVQAIRDHGLTLTGALGSTVTRVEALSFSRATSLRGRADIALIAVKSYETARAAELANGMRTADGVVISMQNGMNDDLVASVVGQDATLGCIVNIGGSLVGPGHAECSGMLEPAFEIGELERKTTPRTERIASLFTVVAPTVPTDNLRGRRWAKLAHNTMFNGLAGITGVGNPVLAGPVPAQIAIGIAAEDIAVAAALGVRIDTILGVPAELFVRGTRPDHAAEARAQLVAAASHLPNEVTPSLLQDVRRGRRTEVGQLNGWVVAQGRETGIPTPFNELVVELVQQLETDRAQPALATLDAFSPLIARQIGL